MFADNMSKRAATELDVDPKRPRLSASPVHSTGEAVVDSVAETTASSAPGTTNNAVPTGRTDTAVVAAVPPASSTADVPASSAATASSTDVAPIQVSTTEAATTQGITAAPEPTQAPQVIYSPPVDLVYAAIGSLTEAEAKSNLFTLVQYHPEFAHQLVSLHAFRQAEEARRLAAAPPRSFDYLSKSCWHAMNMTHLRKRGSQRFESAADVMYDDLEPAIQTILRGCLREHPTPGTRANGLETLRKISKSVLLCDVDEIRRELMNGLGAPGALAGAMVQILQAMGPEEIERFSASQTAEGIRWVDQAMAEYSAEDYTKVIDLIFGPEDADESDQRKGQADGASIAGSRPEQAIVLA